MTELECPHCGYGWDYGGQLLSATCPSCKGTVRVDDQTEAETENEA